MLALQFRHQRRLDIANVPDRAELTKIAPTYEDIGRWWAFVSDVQVDLSMFRDEALSDDAKFILGFG